MSEAATLDKAALNKHERSIARKYAERFPIEIVLWGLGNTVIWLSLWPLVFFDIIPLWLGFIVATLNLMLSYLPSHDAQHDIIAQKGKKLRWLNELVGHVSLIPLVLTFRVARATHMEHHKHANNPELDPDHSTHADGPMAAFLKTITNRQPGCEGGVNAYGPALIRLGRTDLLMESVIAQFLYFGILFGLALSGYAIEAALLWWLPRHIAISHLQFFLSWAPHHPGEGIGRYKDTRAFKSQMGNIFSMGMQYHIVHHLHPYIPLTDTPAAYREMRPILEERGCRMDGI